MQLNKSKIVASVVGQGERLLRQHELDAVSGGFQDEENFMERGFNLLIVASYLRENGSN